MWNTDFNLASVVRKDQELWERKVIRVQRMGGFERAEEGPIPAHERVVPAPLGRLARALA